MEKQTENICDPIFNMDNASILFLCDCDALPVASVYEYGYGGVVYTAHVASSADL